MCKSSIPAFNIKAIQRKFQNLLPPIQQSPKKTNKQKSARIMRKGFAQRRRHLIVDWVTHVLVCLNTRVQGHRHQFNTKGCVGRHAYIQIVYVCIYIHTNVNQNENGNLTLKMRTCVGAYVCVCVRIGFWIRIWMLMLMCRKAKNRKIYSIADNWSKSLIGLIVADWRYCYRVAVAA